MKASTAQPDVSSLELPSDHGRALPMLDEAVRRDLLEVVETQVRTGDPPLTAVTLARLQREGATRAEAMDLLLVALLTELNEVVRTQLPFDASRYARALS